MADNPNKGKEVDMNSPFVKQHKKMAAGIKVTGQSSPGVAAPKKKAKVKK